MLKKLFKHGDNLAIIIDTSILESLNITKDTELNIRTDDGSIMIEPMNEEAVYARINRDLKSYELYKELDRAVDAFFKKENSIK